MSLRFAMVSDTHVGLPPSGLAERLSLVYEAIARSRAGLRAALRRHHRYRAAG